MEELKYTSKFDGQQSDEILEKSKKLLNAELTTLSDISGFVAIDNEGKAIGMMSKEQVASVVGELLKNTYSSFSLETGTEQMIASGIGVYYVSDSYFDSISILVVMDYDSAYLLGNDYRVEFRVEEAKLYATAKHKNQDIRIRKIAIK